MGRYLAKFYLATFWLVVLLIFLLGAGLFLLWQFVAVCHIWYAGQHDFEAADGTATLRDCSRCGAKNKRAGFD